MLYAVLRPLMDTNAQRFLHYYATPTTALRCLAQVNPDMRLTSISCFVLYRDSRLIRGRICDAFCQAVVANHRCVVQVFKNDYVETVYQLPAFLAGNGFIPIRHPLTDTRNDLAVFCPCRRPLRLLAQVALCLFQVVLIATKQARVINCFTRQGLISPLLLALTKLLISTTTIRSGELRI